MCINPNLILRVWFTSDSSTSTLCIWEGAVALNSPSWVFRVIGDPPWSTLVGVRLLDGPWNVAVVGPLNKNVTLKIVLKCKEVLSCPLRTASCDWALTATNNEGPVLGHRMTACTVSPSRRGTLLLCKCRVSSDCQGRAGGAKGLAGWGERAGGVSLIPRPCGRLCARYWDPLVTCSDTHPKVPFGWLLCSDEHVTEHFHFLLSLPVWTRIIKSSF